MLCVLEFLITCRLIPTEECLSKRLTGGILTVPIGDGEVREYRLTKQSRDGATKYYRCSKCSSLHRKLKTGILAKVIVKNGVVPLEQPQHHPDCHPIRETKAIATQIDRRCRSKVRLGQLAPRAVHNEVC